MATQPRENWKDRRLTPKRTLRKRRRSVYKPVPGRQRFNTVPTDAQIASIPYIPVVEFDLNDKETKRFRSRLYGINKDGIRRYRTLREGTILLVWRIE